MVVQKFIQFVFAVALANVCIQEDLPCLKPKEANESQTAVLNNKDLASLFEENTALIENTGKFTVKRIKWIKAGNIEKSASIFKSQYQKREVISYYMNYVVFMRDLNSNPNSLELFDCVNYERPYEDRNKPLSSTVYFITEDNFGHLTPHSKIPGPFDKLTKMNSIQRMEVYLRMSKALMGLCGDELVHGFVTYENFVAMDPELKTIKLTNYLYMSKPREIYTGRASQFTPFFKTDRHSIADPYIDLYGLVISILSLEFGWATFSRQYQKVRNFIDYGEAMSTIINLADERLSQNPIHLFETVEGYSFRNLVRQTLTLSSENFTLKEFINQFEIIIKALLDKYPDGTLNDGGLKFKPEDLDITIQPATFPGSDSDKANNQIQKDQDGLSKDIIVTGIVKSDEGVGKPQIVDETKTSESNPLLWIYIGSGVAGLALLGLLLYFCLI